ncbi:MAG: hypothetical protein WCK70_14170 [Chloroflexales bacterium]
MQLPDISLDAIPDPATRQLVGQLMNLIEALVAENTALRAEVQHLRDENARLKGGSGKPDVMLSDTAPPMSSSRIWWFHRGGDQIEDRMTDHRSRLYLLRKSPLSFSSVWYSWAKAS